MLSLQANAYSGPQGGGSAQLEADTHAATSQSDRMHYLHHRVRQQVQLVNPKCQVIKVLIKNKIKEKG